MLNRFRAFRERGWTQIDAPSYQQAWQRFGGSVATHPLVVERLAADYAGCVVKEIPTPEPGPGEVLYKIIGAGLCHSDLSTIENLRPRKLPTIPGHEAAGIVVLMT